MSVTAERLRACRIALGMSLAAVYKATGVARKTLNHYEKGRYDPRAPIVALLAKCYGVSCDYLLGLTDIKQTNRWIACKESLPLIDPCSVCVAIWTKECKRWRKGHYAAGKFYRETDTCAVIEYDATHWRPDLEPPADRP